MDKKVTVSSSSRDIHGDTLSIELLKQVGEQINGIQKMRMLINHRRDLPPIGYWDNAELEYKEELCLLKAEPIRFQKKEAIVGKNDFIKESFEKPISFSERKFEKNQPLTLTFDKNNFQSWEIVESISQKLAKESDDPIQIKYDARKEFTPDPRLIITLTTYYSVIYPLVKPFIKKIGEKIAEDIGDDIYHYSKKKIKNFAKTLKNYISTVRLNSHPKNKKLITIFEIPGNPYIELHAKTDDAHIIVNSIAAKKITRIHKQIIELEKLIRIKEVYFELNGKGNWRFSYLIAEDGSIIGTKGIMNKREYLLNRINLSPTKGFSIGGDVKYSKKKHT